MTTNASNTNMATPQGPLHDLDFEMIDIHLTGGFQGTFAGEVRVKNIGTTAHSALITVAFHQNGRIVAKATGSVNQVRAGAVATAALGSLDRWDGKPVVFDFHVGLES